MNKSIDERIHVLHSRATAGQKAKESLFQALYDQLKRLDGLPILFEAFPLYVRVDLKSPTRIILNGHSRAESFVRDVDPRTMLGFTILWDEVSQKAYIRSDTNHRETVESALAICLGIVERAFRPE